MPPEWKRVDTGERMIVHAGQTVAETVKTTRNSASTELAEVVSDIPGRASCQLLR